MPLIQLKLIFEKVLSSAQKAELICKLTDVLASVEGENFAPLLGDYRGSSQR
jgi:phenylpyruvate tautomerase PptA (4-oxalocrotonate tautomerase family)